jgi:hypothetical protein
MILLHIHGGRNRFHTPSNGKEADQQTMKKWSWRRNNLLLLIAIAALTSCLGSHAFMEHIYGFSASSKGGTRAGSEDRIQFPFDGPLQPDGLPAPWQSRVIIGQLQARVVNDPSHGKVIQMTCDRSHFVLWYEAVPFDPRKYPILSWSWKAIALPARGDTRTHTATPIIGDNRNDKSLQLMIGFEGDYVLNYVWDSNAPVGYECDEWSPVATVRTTVVDSGTTHLNQWLDHHINVLEDYQRRYGKPPGKVLGITLSANTNNTADRGDGLVGTISASVK